MTSLIARYLPTNNRIPANRAMALMNLLGITKRTNAGRPFRMSQIANSIIPVDIWFLPLLMFTFPASVVYRAFTDRFP